MIEGLEKLIINTRMTISSVLSAMNENPDDQKMLITMQKWATGVYEGNQVLRNLAIEDEDLDWEDIEQLCIIKHYLIDIYNATDKLLLRTRYD